MKKLITIIVTMCMIFGYAINVYASSVDDICYVEPNRVCIVSNADTPNWTYNIYENKKWKIFSRDINSYEGFKKVNKKYPTLSDGITIKKVTIKKMKNKNKKVTFTFNNLPTDSKYKVMVYDNERMKHKILTKTFKKNTKSFTFKNVKPNQEYYIKIKLIKDNGSYLYTKNKIFIIEE